VATDPDRFYIKLCLNSSKINREGEELLGNKFIEEYSFSNPKVLIGNLIIGETFIEPQGSIEVMNHSTGERAELEFKTRGWISTNKDQVVGVIKDSSGAISYHLKGKYTSSLDAFRPET
jgi:hypothetical protein